MHFTHTSYVDVAVQAQFVSLMIVLCCECRCRTIDLSLVCRFIHGLLHISGLYQFIDVIECGEHSRLLGIGETGAFFINIMAILSILSCSRRSHILEESQNLNVIGRWLPQLVQFSVDKKSEKSSEKSSEKRHVSL